MAVRLAEKLMILCDRGNGLLLRLYNLKTFFLNNDNTNVNTSVNVHSLSNVLAEAKNLSSFVKNVLATKKFANLSNAFGGTKTVDDLLRLKQVTSKNKKYISIVKNTLCTRVFKTIK